MPRAARKSFALTKSHARRIWLRAQRLDEEAPFSDGPPERFEQRSRPDPATSGQSSPRACRPVNGWLSFHPWIGKNESSLMLRY